MGGVTGLIESTFCLDRALRIASESYTNCRKFFVNLEGLGQKYNGRTQIKEHYTNDIRD